MTDRLVLILTATLQASPTVALTCAQDCDFVSPTGHDQGAASRTTLKKGLGATAKGDFDTFMSIAADPYIQHSHELPDGWKPIWGLTTNRERGLPPISPGQFGIRWKAQACA